MNSNRKEFEEYCRNNWAGLSDGEFTMSSEFPGEYEDDDWQERWELWQAARGKGVDVPLPFGTESAYEDATFRGKGSNMTISSELVVELIDEICRLNSHGCCGSTPIAEVVSGYSGDPDTKGDISIRVLDTYKCRIGDKLYTHPQPAQHGSVPEEVIKRCEESIEYAAEIRGGCISGVREAQKRVRAILTTPQPEGDGWIKCSERLPELTGWYCVALTDPDDIGWSTSVSWAAFWNGDAFEECDPVEDGQPVTHWMPFPKPPQEGE